MNTKQTRQMNDAMRHMWYATWSQMRTDRYRMQYDAVLARAWASMGRHHTWRMEPRHKVLACAGHALLTQVVK